MWQSKNNYYFLLIGQPNRITKTWRSFFGVLLKFINMKIKIEPTDSRLEELQNFQFSYNLGIFFRLKRKLHIHLYKFLGKCSSFLFFCTHNINFVDGFLADIWNLV
jgi:hypothetical protein